MSYAAARPLLFLLDPETAHGVTLVGLRLAHRLGLTALAGLPGRALDGPAVETMGLRFPNPVGLAAGLDKNGECINAMAALGFGFVEIGTVTPRPQPGNPKPRLFRLPEARAIINRFGFNNVGVERLVENVRTARFEGILGINIGKNFDTPIERAADDYVACLSRVYPHASYVVVNISSPNTKNLRQLQNENELGGLLAAVARERDRQRRSTNRRVPLVVKIAPDLDDDAVAAIAELLVRYEIDGVAATNTTLSREGVEGLPHANEAGGLSGAPLTARSTVIIAKLSAALAGRIPIIGVGGIMNAEDARAKLAAGAQLVQIYSGLIYRGPGLVREIVDALRRVNAARTE